MSLAKAVFMVPREIEVAPGYDWVRKPPADVVKWRWPREVRLEIARCAILCRGLNEKPVSWQQISDHIGEKFGIYRSERAMSSIWAEWKSRRGGILGVHK